MQVGDEPRDTLEMFKMQPKFPPTLLLSQVPLTEWTTNDATHTTLTKQRKLTKALAR